MTIGSFVDFIGIFIYNFQIMSFFPSLPGVQCDALIRGVRPVQTAETSFRHDGAGD